MIDLAHLCDELRQAASGSDLRCSTELNRHRKTVRAWIYSNAKEPTPYDEPLYIALIKDVSTPDITLLAVTWIPTLGCVGKQTTLHISPNAEMLLALIALETIAP